MERARRFRSNHRATRERRSLAPQHRPSLFERQRRSDRSHCAVLAARPTLLGDYPGTRALRRGDVTSPLVRLAFADVKSASAGFKRAVRDLEFDVAELAIVTFLLAKAHGKPLVLLPAVVLGRFQHPYLVYNHERGRLAPSDLTGRRVGIRSYSVTTVTWLRGILAEEYGVDLECSGQARTRICSECCSRARSTPPSWAASRPRIRASSRSFPIPPAPRARGARSTRRSR
jgi:hypothetical protein